MPYLPPAPRTPEEVAIQAWVRSVLSAYDGDYDQPIGVAFSDQKAPRRFKPYATILKLSEVTNGEDVDEYFFSGPNQTGDPILRVSSRREGTFRVTIYGGRHTQLARALELSMTDRQVSDANLAAGITVAQVIGGQVRRSRDTDGVTEDRTVTDYAVRYRVWVDRVQELIITSPTVDIDFTEDC
jgi:hypothetical protein